MSILWLIIKIILILLFGICGLTFILLGIILLAPIRYEAYLAKYEDLSYDIKVTYLMGIKGIFYLDEGKKNHKISIFKRVLYQNKDEEVPCESEETQSKEKDLDALNEKSSDSNKQQGLSQKKVMHKPVLPSNKVVKDEKEVNPQLKKEAEAEVVEASETVKNETIKTVEKMPSSWITKLIWSKETYGAIKQVCKCVWRIIQTIWPYEWDFEVIVGQEDPADTGELIAKLTLLYPLYYRHGIVRGDYERECLEGGFLIKGKFNLGHILWHIMRCAFSYSVRYFIKLIIELRKEEKNGK